jgi:molybdate transport system regulatory protein
MTNNVRISMRVELAAGRSIGPGKVRLLELVRETGSISAAGRAMSMSYRRAWLLIDELNHMFREPVVVSRMGGASGGGATLTAFGAEVVDRYRAIEARVFSASEADLTALAQALAPHPVADTALRPKTPRART